MLTVVATVYALSWLPLHAMTLIGDSYPAVYDLPHIDLLWMSFHWLAFSNTAMNPIIYCRSNSVFRNSLKLCFNRFKKGNKDNFELILSDRRMSNCNAQSVSMRIWECNIMQLFRMYENNIKTIQFIWIFCPV